MIAFVHQFLGSQCIDCSKIHLANCRHYCIDCSSCFFNYFSKFNCSNVVQKFTCVHFFKLNKKQFLILVSPLTNDPWDVATTQAIEFNNQSDATKGCTWAMGCKQWMRPWPNNIVEGCMCSFANIQGAQKTINIEFLKNNLLSCS